MLLISVNGQDEHPQQLPLMSVLDHSADVSSDTAKSNPLNATNLLANEPTDSVVSHFKSGKFGTVVDASNCIKKCSGNGECQAVFKNTSNKNSEVQSKDVIYLCI